MKSLPGKILIVEDEGSIVRSLTDMLTAEGFEVIQARDGETGFKKAVDEKPDLILLDLLIPKVDGMTMMEKLRENDWGRNVKVIILTNLQPDDKIVKCISKYEPTYYFVKTEWHIDDVLVKIKTVLNVPHGAK